MTAKAMRLKGILCWKPVALRNHNSNIPPNPRSYSNSHEPMLSQFPFLSRSVFRKPTPPPPLLDRRSHSQARPEAPLELQRPRRPGGRMWHRHLGGTSLGRRSFRPRSAERCGRSGLRTAEVQVCAFGGSGGLEERALGWFACSLLGGCSWTPGSG